MATTPPGAPRPRGAPGAVQEVGGVARAVEHHHARHGRAGQVQPAGAAVRADQHPQLSLSRRGRPAVVVTMVTELGTHDP
jgi:hypothetical protein